MNTPSISRDGMARLLAIYDRKKQERVRYDTVWKDAARWIYPSMSDWNDEPEVISGKKPEDVGHIYDTTVQKASQTLTDGIQGYSFARNQAWFKEALEEYDELNAAEAAWLEKVERHKYRQLQKSNFYDEGRSFVKCGAAFGTAIMFREDDLNRGIPVYRTQHLKRCLIDENQYGEVDVLFRDFWITVTEAAERFGLENLPLKLQEAHRSGSQDLYQFVQYTGPEERYNLGVKSKRAFYTLFWSAADRNTPIAEDGYSIKPFFVWRWSRNLDGDVWGADAPGMTELPTIKQLNIERKSSTKNIQLAVEPPLKMTPGLKGKVNLTPRGSTELRPGQDFTPAMVVGKLEYLGADMADLRKSINEAHYVDFFLILSQNMEKQKTATEVSGIQGEKAALLSAFYGRLASEFLEVVLEDLFALELRAGRLPLPPETLKGKELRIDMVSPMAQLQERYLKVGASQQAMAEIVAIAQIKPETLDNYDLDVYSRNIGETYGLDKRIIRDLIDVEKLREARMKQQAALMQQQQQMEQAKLGADIASKVS